MDLKYRKKGARIFWWGMISMLVTRSSGNSMRGMKKEGFRQHPIRRIYGEDNRGVRDEVHRLEQESTNYWKIGVRENPDFKVEYENHPFQLMEEERQRRRRKLSGSGLTEEQLELEISRDLQASTLTNSTRWRPMRIKFDTAALDLQRNSLNGQQIDFIKNTILPRTVDYWSKALKVVPVEDRLRIQPGELANRQFCGDSEFARVPASHISDGIPDVDMILYVSGQPSTRFCGPTTLAVAVACNFDQYDRPTAGAINFCLDQVEVNSDGTASQAIIDDNVDVAIHEAAHVLGMSSNSYRFFWDPKTGEPRTSRSFGSTSVTCVDGVTRNLILPSENTMKFFVAKNGKRYAAIVTEKVTTVARNQFNCQTLAGGQLENQPTGTSSCTGDHWDERLFYPEALSGVISPTTNILSPLTLALMEDSGWYQASYNLSKVSPWGHNASCAFVSDNCLKIDPITGQTVVPDYGEGYFCTRASERGCAPSHHYKMACTLIDYDLFFPPRLPDPEFVYFPDQPSQGGPRQADYCPLFGSTYAGLRPEELDCRDSDNKDLINLYSEEYGEDSMCFETSSGEGRCYQSKCVIDEFKLKVNVRGQWYTCNHDFEKISVRVAGGTISTTITCPRLSSTCPDMFCPVNCAGRGHCNFSKNVNGTVRPTCECFDETDTSLACSESIVFDGRYADDSSDLNSFLKKSFFDTLVAVFVDHPDTWTTGSWAWAAGLLVLLLLMILCICTNLWPSRRNQRGRRR